MKVELAGWRATVASSVSAIVVIFTFLASGAAVALAPFNFIWAPVVLVLLIFGFWFILTPRQYQEYPEHVYATSGMLAGAYIFMAAITVGWGTFVSIPALLAGVGLAMVLGLGLWKDYVLGDTEFEKFTIEIAERGDDGRN